MTGAPESFHPLVREWFSSTFGEATPVQAAAWPPVSNGRNVLAIAPTGSGKTLAAFLDAVSSFASGRLDPSKLQVLYVSPLKALNEDIRENLQRPLRSLGAFFHERGVPFPSIAVMTRSGDTPPGERRRMISKPPSILATTPESLSIILNSPKSRSVLSCVRLVILDEIHAVLESKRGSFLSVSLERLALIAGEFQRIALSATVEPPELAAAFVAGTMPGPDGSLRPRDLLVVSPQARKRIELSVRYPPVGGGDAEEPSRHAAIAADIRLHLRDSASALVFVEARRTAERLAKLINDASGEGTAYAHHGSLSKETRRSVEKRLRDGRLRCVVATASLELGIDIGSVEEVLLVGTPPSVSRALQRIGRSGHAVGRPSRATLYPLHDADLLRAAALAAAIPPEGGGAPSVLDPLSPPVDPLDVLSQVLVSMCACDPWKSGELYDFVRRSFVFRSLPRELFDATVESLRERGTGAETGQARPRLSFDDATGTLRAAAGMLALVYSSGGAIPDRGAFALRVRGSGARLGELDEEFVWERRVGDSFTFGTQAWRIAAIADDAVEVTPLGRATEFMPFWKAEPGSVGGTLARGMLAVLDDFGRMGDARAFERRLVEASRFDDRAAAGLARFLALQSAAQRDREGRLVPLPGVRSLAVELTSDSSRRGDAISVIIHAVRGRRILQPLAIALSEVLSGAFGIAVRTSCDDFSILFELPDSPDFVPERAIREAFSSLALPGRLDAAVRAGAPASGVFGSLFRENAERALLLPKGGFGKRKPLWITRLRAKRLFAKLASRPDHPVIVETYRSCLRDVFDLDGARSLVEGVAAGEMTIGFFRSAAPSPLARGILWRETNVKLYESDELGHAGSGSATDRAISLAIGDARARIPVRRAVFMEALSRLRREEKDWAPSNLPELESWVRERLALTAEAFRRIVAAMPPGTGPAYGILPDSLVAMKFPGAGFELVVHRDNVGIAGSDPAELLGRWLPYEGAIDIPGLESTFGWNRGKIEAACALLAESGKIVRGGFAEGEDDESLCDADAYMYMLRRGRKGDERLSRPRPAAALAPFFAEIQGLRAVVSGSCADAAAPDAVRLPEGQNLHETSRRSLAAHMEALEGIPYPAGYWETELLPDRVAGYLPSALDDLLACREWMWYGAGEEMVAFSRVELFAAFSRNMERGPFADIDEDLDFWELRDRLGLSLAACERLLWRSAWAGLVSSDSFRALRLGVRDGFISRRAGPDPAGEPVPVAAERNRPLPRAVARARARMDAPVQSGRGLPRQLLPGRWYGLELETGCFDEVDEAELAADRARAALGRYGVVCAATLSRENGACSWSSVYPALRRLELAGDAFAGYFFEGLGGPQFMSGRSIDALERSEDGPPRIYSMNAADPASICGLGLPDPEGTVPSRSATARLVFRGSELVAVARASGKDLSLRLAPADPDLPAIAMRLADPVRRAVEPLRRIVVETVNGVRAADSPYATALESAGFEPDRGAMMLWR
ncbi:MAG: DEAD/DEAH box helicase [Spirochaetes bacterium]|nr:DEAD/DEAH box helicase [Spirochaetota bacterium]